MFVTRLATAIVLLAGCISTLLWLPNPWWAALLLPILLAGAWEWGGLAGLRRSARWLFAGIVLGSAVFSWQLVANSIPAVGRLTPAEAVIYGTGCAFWLFAALPWLAWRWRTPSPLLLCAAGWAVLVPAWLALARLQTDPERLLALLGIIWLSDAAAYLSGKAWGRHQLAPTISPGKTWEGVAGAGAAVAVYYVVLSKLAPAWNWWDGFGGVVLFAGVALMGIVGDLFESWVKRLAAVKDSGSLLPGHGGILDRIDSITAALPISALLLRYAG